MTANNGTLYRVLLATGTCAANTSASATLTVTNSVIATDDNFTATPIYAGTGGVFGNVLTNDLYNNSPAVANQVTLSVTNDGGLTGVALDANGNLTAPASATQGTYTITYTACDATSANNCDTATVTVIVLPTLGVPTFTDASISLYPNPAISKVYIKVANIALYNNMKVVVYDMNGRQLIVQTLNASENTIDIDRFASGTYLFTITSDTAKINKRVIKQ